MHYITRYLRFAPPLSRHIANKSSTVPTVAQQFDSLQKSNPYFKTLINEMREEIKNTKNSLSQESTTPIDSTSMLSALEKENESRKLSLY